MHQFGTIFVGEFTRKLQSRPFLIGVVIGVMVLFAMTRLPSLMARLAPASAHRVVIIGDGGIAARAATLLGPDFTIAGTLPRGAPDAAVLQAHDADTAIAVGVSGGSLAVTVFAKHPADVPLNNIRRDLVPLALERVAGLSEVQVGRAIDIPINIRPVDSRFGSRGEEEAAHRVATILLFLLYLVILSNGQQVMASVAEEKTSRIAEVLVASVNPRTLLVGKVLAGTAVAVLQLIVWVGCAVYFSSTSSGAGGATGSLSALGPSLAVGNLLAPGTLIAFFAFFFIGLLQLSMLLASAGSMINRPEDIGSLAFPLVMPVLLALFIGIGAIGSPDAIWAVTASMIPVVSPFVMFARIAVGIVPAWQLVLSIGINLAALAVIAWGSGRVYRVGMLFFGRAPSFAQIVRALRTAS